MKTLGGFVAITGLMFSAGAVVSYAAEGKQDDRIRQARQLINDYYGDRAVLDQATELISDVLRSNPDYASAYIEAARVTLKGGHIVSNKFRPGAKDFSKALLDKALALEPNNPLALSLKASSYLSIGATEDAWLLIQRGLSAAPENPWLKLKLGDYHDAKQDYEKSLAAYRSVLTRSCDIDTEYRRACVQALMAQIKRLHVPEQQALVRNLAKRTMALRHPQDAWTLGTLGHYFAEMGQMDDAIEYGRQALQVMNYGVGRLNLAAALYTKAAMNRSKGMLFKELIEEADALSVAEEEVLDWYRNSPPPLRIHLSGVIKLFESRHPAPLSR